MKTTAVALAVFLALIWGSSLQAQFSVGTWVQTSPMKGFTMTVEECCSGGRRLIFHVTLGQKTQTITVDSRFDGSDAPVLADGKPNGETMALKRVDERQMTTVFKRNGKVYRTSTSTESADRKTLTVENEFIEPAGKMTETYEPK
jgi:hypothetical protein